MGTHWITVAYSVQPQVAQENIEPMDIPSGSGTATPADVSMESPSPVKKLSGIKGKLQRMFSGRKKSRSATPSPMEQSPVAGETMEYKCEYCKEKKRKNLFFKADHQEPEIQCLCCEQYFHIGCGNQYRSVPAFPPNLAVGNNKNNSKLLAFCNTCSIFNRKQFVPSRGYSKENLKTLLADAAVNGVTIRGRQGEDIVYAPAFNQLEKDRLSTVVRLTKISN